LAGVQGLELRDGLEPGEACWDLELTVLCPGYFQLEGHQLEMVLHKKFLLKTHSSLFGAACARALKAAYQSFLICQEASQKDWATC